MGLFFTVIYLLYMLGAPAAWLPFLVGTGMQIYLSAVACVSTLPRLLNGSLIRHTPQVLTFGGFFSIVVLSPLLQRWFGGVLGAFREQVPYIVLLFLVRVNCDTTARRKSLILALLLLITALAAVGAYNYHAHQGDLENKFIFRHHLSEEVEGADESDLQWDFRLKAQGILDDPNDFAQAMLVTIALSTVFWGQGVLSNIFLVLVPGSILLYGIYLTHSRGALVAIVITMIVVLHRRLKIWGASLAGLALASGLVFMRFTGGRQISIASGTDRLDIWSDGLYLLKHSFGLGIGYNFFVDNVGHTAHNSILLVAVETGLLGLALFAATIVICFTQLNRIARPVDGSPPDAVLAHESRCYEAAFAAYLATSWFLSRAYNPLPYLLVGLVATLAFQRAEAAPDAPLLPSWLKIAWNTGIVAFVSLACIYAMVRLRSVGSLH